MSCWVFLTLNLPVGVISAGSLITVFSLRVLSSTTTMARLHTNGYQCTLCHADQVHKVRPKLPKIRG